MLKPQRYPLAIILRAIENELQEVTQVVVFKGDTGETLKRHVESIIPLLTSKTADSNEDLDVSKENNIAPLNENNSVLVPVPIKVKRKAAIQGMLKTKQFADQGLT